LLDSSSIALSRAAPSAPWNQGSFPPPALPGFLGTTSPSATRSARTPHVSVRPGDGVSETGFPCCPLFLAGMLSPTTPAKWIGLVVRYCPVHGSLPPVQAGSAFASCLSGPPRCSLTLRPASLQTARSCLLSPRLQSLRCLRNRWDSYPAGTTFAGAGLSPAGTTDLCTAHVDQYSIQGPSVGDADLHLANWLTERRFRQREDWLHNRDARRVTSNRIPRGIHAGTSRADAGVSPGRAAGLGLGG